MGPITSAMLPRFGEVGMFVKIGKLFLVLVTGVVFVMGAARADSVSISAPKFNTLYQDSNGALSNGAGPSFFIGNTNQGKIRRGLLFFDIASVIPAGATIDSVTLTLNMINSATTTAYNADIYRVRTNWGQGSSNAGLPGGSGVASMTDDATWVHTFYNTSFWAVSGGDFETSLTPAIRASTPVGGLGAYTWSSAELVQDVQYWLGNPTQNYGWMLRGDESTNQTTKGYASDKHATATIRPVLDVTYTPSGVDVGPQGPYALQMRVSPNPFRAAEQVSFSLPRTSQIHLAIYDVRGRQVAVLENGTEFSEGVHTISWNGRTVRGQPASAGVYFARLITPDDGMRTVRILRVR